MRGRVGTRTPARGLRGRKATGHPDRLLGKPYGTLSGTCKRPAPDGARVANDRPRPAPSDRRVPAREMRPNIKAALDWAFQQGPTRGRSRG
jgi:hypothetical protein